MSSQHSAPAFRQRPRNLQHLSLQLQPPNFPSHIVSTHSPRYSDEQNAPFDPAIISATDSALAPVRHALDTVWNLTLSNMRVAMAKTHKDFTSLANQERQKNVHLLSKVASLENELHASRQEVLVLKEEREDFQNIIQAYKDRHQRLHGQPPHPEIEHGGKEGRRSDSERVAQFDMNTVLGAVTEQMSKEIELKVSTLREQIEQQQQAFAHTLQHIHSRDASEAAASQSPYVLAHAPSFRKGSYSSTSTRVVSPASSKESPTARSATRGDDMEIPSPAANQPSFIAVQKNSPLSSIPMGMGHPYTLSSPTHNLVRRASTFEKQPRKRPRLSDESEQDGPRTPNFPSSAVVSIESDHERRPQPERVPSAIQTEEQNDADVNQTEDGEFVPGGATVKSEPAEIYMGMENSHSTQPSPVSRTTSVLQAPITEPRLASIPPKAPPVSQRNIKLGIGHIDLLYKTENGIMTCRMCLSRSRGSLSVDHLNKMPPVKKIEQEKATWDELISHCRNAHPRKCQDLERLSPTQVAEMKQRMMSGERSSGLRA